MTQTGVLIAVDGPPRRLEEAIPAAFAELGFGPGKGLSVALHPSPRGLWIQGELSRPTALALAARLAAALGRPTRLVTAFSAKLKTFELELADDRVSADGTRTATSASPTRALIAQHGDDWSDICDGKAQFLVSSALDAILETDRSHGEVRELTFAHPPSLGDPKLDALATEIRLAARSETTVVEGRTCIRIRTLDGATVTRFLSAETIQSVAGLLRPG